MTEPLYSSHYKKQIFHTWETTRTLAKTLRFPKLHRSTWIQNKQSFRSQEKLIFQQVKDPSWNGKDSWMYYPMEEWQMVGDKTKAPPEAFLVLTCSLQCPRIWRKSIFFCLSQIFSCFVLVISRRCDIFGIVLSNLISSSLEAHLLLFIM